MLCQMALTRRENMFAHGDLLAKDQSTKKDLVS